MYLPKHFEEARIDVLHALIRARPLATLVTMSATGITANHLPLHLSPGQGELGCLQGHVARSNPVWQDFVPAVEALAIFHGPEGYISPSWYPTKQQHGKVVPTWNYAVVHVTGVLRVIDDPAWLRKQLEAITTQSEAVLPHPWAVADAPPEYVERLAAGIVGIELAITKISGKWKMSQNQPTENQAGVIAALGQRGDTELAALVEKSTRTSD